VVLKLVVGLGNPGKSYAFTRHNLGFRVVDYSAGQFNLKFKKSVKQQAYIAEGNGFVFLKPYTFMNLSGRSVRKAADKFCLPFSSILVICDDLALPLGKIRIKPKGSSGGHKGLASIIDSLGTEDFARVRIGIFPQNGLEEDASSFVLGRFSAEEDEDIKQVVVRANECVLSWINEGITKTMAEFN